MSFSIATGVRIKRLHWTTRQRQNLHSPGVTQKIVLEIETRKVKGDAWVIKGIYTCVHPRVRMRDTLAESSYSSLWAMDSTSSVTSVA